MPQRCPLLAKEPFLVRPPVGQRQAHFLKQDIIFLTGKSANTAHLYAKASLRNMSEAVFSQLNCLLISNASLLMLLLFWSLPSNSIIFLAMLLISPTGALSIPLE